LSGTEVSDKKRFLKRCDSMLSVNAKRADSLGRANFDQRMKLKSFTNAGSGGELGLPLISVCCA
jgi:hypothetical protein